MIEYKKGDVLEVKCNVFRLIPHCCNNLGGWGSGFVVALSHKWKEPEKQYRSLKGYVLGDVQFVQVEPNIVVANMIAQRGYLSSSNPTPLNYVALEKCMGRVGERIHSVKTPFIITAPKFGAGLAGGNWNTIEKMINETWGDLHVEIYEL
jgi:O-acetyl-ADP-ribose deacetylase (regulator of RNase III)